MALEITSKVYGPENLKIALCNPKIKKIGIDKIKERISASKPFSDIGARFPSLR